MHLLQLFRYNRLNFPVFVDYTAKMWYTLMAAVKKLSMKLKLQESFKMNIAVAQSGGPTCAINASLLGVFRQALKEEQIEHIFGSINGIEGIINDRLVELNAVITTAEDMELLRQTPSTVLGSCRYKLPDVKDDETVYKQIIDCFLRHGIGAFFYIGGNDSMDTVAKLGDYVKNHSLDIRIIGIPKTIDNDLACTDHTPGFGSAAKYVATTIQEIIRDSSVYSIDSVTVVEVMGRHAGWLTASSCVLRANGETAPHLIYLPECDFSAEKFIEDVKKARQVHKAVIVAVSEGLKIDGDYSNSTRKVDSFGHEALSGIGKQLEMIISEEMHCKVRSIELNVMQRCSSHLSSKTDIEEAEIVAEEAVRYAMNGGTGVMMGFRRVSNTPYTVKVEPFPAEAVANKERFFPKKWINDAENNVTNEALEYFLPLIHGEQIIRMNNGVPIHFHL